MVITLSRVFAIENHKKNSHRNNQKQIKKEMFKADLIMKIVKYQFLGQFIMKIQYN